MELAVVRLRPRGYPHVLCSWDQPESDATTGLAEISAAGSAASRRGIPIPREAMFFVRKS
jgi:hypothetical protein